MKRSSKIAVVVVASFGFCLAVAAAFAHPGGMGPGVMRGMGPGTAAESHDPMAGTMPRGPRAGTGPNTTPAPQAPAATEHAH